MFDITSRNLNLRSKICRLNFIQFDSFNMIFHTYYAIGQIVTNCNEPTKAESTYRLGIVKIPVIEVGKTRLLPGYAAATPFHAFFGKSYCS